MTKKQYQEKKEALRNEAIQFQHDIIENNLNWWDYYDYLIELEKKARKYGLVKEFKENAII